jgi:hypothetical protein
MATKKQQPSKPVLKLPTAPELMHKYIIIGRKYGYGTVHEILSYDALTLTFYTKIISNEGFEDVFEIGQPVAWHHMVENIWECDSGQVYLYIWDTQDFSGILTEKITKTIDTA